MVHNRQCSACLPRQLQPEFKLTSVCMTLAYQASLFLGFSRQEYCSTLPCPLPGDLPDLGIRLASLTSPALTGGFFPTSAIWEPQLSSSNPYFPSGSNSKESTCKMGELDNHDGVVTYLEPDILDCEAKRALSSITMNKASRGNEISAELFVILKDDAVKVLHSI